MYAVLACHVLRVLLTAPEFSDGQLRQISLLLEAADIWESDPRQLVQNEFCQNKLRSLQVTSEVFFGRRTAADLGKRIEYSKSQWWQASAGELASMD